MAKEEWHPDVDVTDSLANSLIQSQFESIGPIRTLTCIGEGWDNKVYLVNDALIFRFPHREISSQLIARENQVLAHIHDLMPLDVPHPHYHGHPTDTYPFVFHGYQKIEGVSASHAHLTLAQRENSVAPLALFLKALHQIPEETALRYGASHQVFDRSDITRLLTLLEKRVDKLINEKIADIDQTVFNQEITLAKSIKLPTVNTLVHGDLYSRHLMFNEGRLTGIIDWGDTGINIPAVDLGVVYSFYPPTCHAEFFKIYGTIDSHAHAFARFIGLYIALTVLLYARDMQDRLLESEARQGIQWISPDLFCNAFD